MLNLFLDTEFTDLHPLTKKLISVGVYGIDKDGKVHSFYCELSDTYDRKDCSTFVKQNVLPLLEKKNVLRYNEMIVQLGGFIEDLEEDVTLVSDAPTWDFTFFVEFLSQEELRPNNIRHLAAFTGAVLVPEAMYTREHHALDDAMINALMSKEATKHGINNGVKIISTFY